MKVKQKKLKAENFRYVTKEIIKNPMTYLDDFFRSQTRIQYWLREIGLLVDFAAYRGMACPVLLENGYHCRQLIKQVEVAYVVYRQCNLKKRKKPLSFFKNREDYWSFVIEGESTFDGEINPADTLSKFFSFQSLSEWYETLDDMMMYLADPMDTYDDRFGDKIVAIRELLLRLARALYHICENEGLAIRVPSYFIAHPVLPSGEGILTSESNELSANLSAEDEEPDEAENEERELLDGDGEEENLVHEPEPDTLTEAQPERGAV